MPRINLSGTDTKKFDPIPAGKYKVRMTDGEWREVGPQAKNPGADMYNAEFTIQEGEFQGRHIWTNFLFVDTSFWRIKQYLEATGLFTPEQLAGDLDVDNELLQQCMSVDVVANVKYVPETDDYDAKNEIRKFSSLSAGVSAGASGSGSLLP